MHPLLQWQASARADTLDDVRHVGGYTMEGPERTRYYTDRHGKLLSVNSERMLGLIDSYNRAHGTNLHTPDVALLMSVDVTAFLRYALEQGYDPRTFQPMNDGDAREIEGYIAARRQHGEEHLRETRAWQSEALGWIPGISGVKEAADVIAGKDILTGEPLTKLDYGLAAFSALGPLGKGAKKIVKFSADKIAGKADEVIEGVGEAIHIKVPNLTEGSEWERNVLNSFAGGKAELKTYGEGTTLYRIGDKNGGFWSLIPPPATEFEWRMNTAIKQEWGNNASNLYTMTVPKGS